MAPGVEGERPAGARGERPLGSPGSAVPEAEGFRRERWGTLTETEESEEDRVRAEVVAQLRESLAGSRETMLNMKLDTKTREKWTQIHTNTAQVLNQVLRDRQFKDWEKRLKEMEARGRIVRRTFKRLEISRTPTEQKDETGGSQGTKPDTTPGAERPA